MRDRDVSSLALVSGVNDQRQKPSDRNLDGNAAIAFHRPTLGAVTEPSDGAASLVHPFIGSRELTLRLGESRDPASRSFDGTVNYASRHWLLK